MDVLREEDKEKSGVIPTEEFKKVLQGMGVPLQEEGFEKLFKVYDKKGEGKINYEDFYTEQKFIHAVSCSLYKYNVIIIHIKLMTVCNIM